MQQHEQFMQRAIELARLGLGSVSPNPLVGCVIVHSEKIVAEGWHKQYGGPHAEVNAVENLADKSLLPKSTVYVNLEPCAHHGKTPPCSDLLISQGVKKVVIANSDPNPLVAGKGIQKLREAGTEVIENVLAGEGRTLNKRFFTFMERQRPFIILKWAQTADGFIAKEDYASKWISNEQSRQLVHRWRSQEDAVMVGSNTARYDNPHLDVRLWKGRNPVRIIVDRGLKLDSRLHLFDQSQMTICYNVKQNKQMENLEWVKLDQDDFLSALLKDLFNRGIQSVIVEGGSGLLNQFISNGFWDEAKVFVAEKKFQKGIKAPALHVMAILEEPVGEDVLYHYKNQKS